MNIIPFNSEVVSEDRKVYGDYLNFWPENNNFAAEASTLSLAEGCVLTSMKADITVRDIVTGKEILFSFTKEDKDGSGEDTYGWNYKAVRGHTKPCTLLIIND